MVAALSCWSNGKVAEFFPNSKASKPLVCSLGANGQASTLYTFFMESQTGL
jgi:hypothetical protein